MYFMYSCSIEYAFTIHCVYIIHHISMHTVGCTDSVYCIFYSVHYAIHYTVYSIHYTLYSISVSMYISSSILCTLCTVYTVH